MRDHYVHETLAKIREEQAEHRSEIRGVKDDMGEMRATVAIIGEKVQGVTDMVRRVWYTTLFMGLVFVNAEPKVAVSIVKQLWQGFVK